MKRASLLVVLLLLFPYAASGGDLITTVGEMGERVRDLTRISSQATLPDSDLYDFCGQSLLWTSIDVGGVEANFFVTTVASTPYYNLPDTIVDILFAYVNTSDAETRAIKAWYPQYFDELNLPAFTGTDKEQIPLAYNYWSDTLQLLPVPLRADDTVVIKCLVEHPTAEASGSTIIMRPAYTEAALFYTCHLSCVSVGMWAESEKFFAMYERLKVGLKERYTRRFEVPRTVRE